MSHDEETGPIADPYAGFAELYDWEHDSFDEDLPLYRALAQRWGGPIVELGCGTGRVLSDLAQHGYRCIGVDVSKPMLARADERLRRTNVQDIVTLLNASMLEFALPRSANMAIVALDSFGHVLEQSDQLKSLTSIRRCLSESSGLVLDLSNGNARGEMRDELVHHFTAPAENGSGVITKWVSRVPDPSRQVDDFTVWFDELGPDRVVRRTLVEYTLRYYTRFEIQLLVERAGFEIEDLYGSYSLEPYGPVSERMIVIARPARA